MMIMQATGLYKRALDTQIRVIMALFLREIRTRFGNRKLGILWIFLEPVMHISAFAMLALVFHRMAPFSIPYILFLISGIMPFFLFRHSYTRTVSAVESNKALLVFPQITFMDLTISRVLVEVLSISCAFLIIMGVYSWFVEPFQTGNITQALFAYALFPLLGMSLGLFARPLIAVVPALGGILAFGMRLLYFSSCVMIAPERLPGDALEILRFNPVMHALELFRSGLFNQYWIKQGFGDWGYIGLWIVGLLGFSRILEKRFYRWIVNKRND